MLEIQPYQANTLGYLVATELGEIVDTLKQDI